MVPIVRSPLLWLEGIEAFVCPRIAAIAARGTNAAAAMLALPIRNWRRDGEESSRPALAGSSGVVRSIVDISRSSLRGSTIVLRGLVARPPIQPGELGRRLATSASPGPGVAA